MSPTIDSVRSSVSGTVTAAYAEVLAGVLGVDEVPVDRHFFDDLGADSLLMAQFCARVRKRGDLPTVSMRDVYAHPTIASLAAAAAGRAPPAATPPAMAPAEAPTRTNGVEHVVCGVLQALFYLAYSYAGVVAVIEGYEWMVAGARGAALYLRLILLTSVCWMAMCIVPIAAKWLLIGRWKERDIRIWSLDYLRFWIVRTLIRSNPGIYLFVGSPLYGLYLRALGARVGARALILSADLPVCTDLLTIGAGAVIRRETSFQCYRALAGRIEVGPVTIGRDAYVGEMAVLEIGTAVGERSQLGHGSALLRGQSIPDGERWHGSPARRTETNYLRVEPAPCGALRRAGVAAITLLGVVFLWAPLLELGVGALYSQVSSWIESLDAGTASGAGEPTTRALVLKALVFSAALFFGVAFAGVVIVGTVPRLLRGFLDADRVYPLYGFHHAVHRVIAGLNRITFFGVLFGDSSYIVHYLRWLGWRLTPLLQTGSNFGCEVATANPFLTSVGTGTMIADGLNVIPDDYSSSSFRVSRTAIGPKNFLGNYVNYPAGGRTGANCLLAIKAMVPIDGEIRENVGLLGSPPFEIPRSVERDSRFDHLRSGEALRRGLAAKNRFNLRTIGIFLLTRWAGVFLVTLADLAAFELFPAVSAHAVTALLVALGAIAAAVYYAAVEGCFERLSPPPPPICSIYDSRFWWVERIWKLHPISFLALFDGTPFKSLLWRLIGVRMGRRVFDDGAYISEPMLTTIGDECVLNRRSIIQCDSQEDGTYKSGRVAIGNGCTLGVSSFVHYGSTMGDGSALSADAFLMKGEEVPPGARWQGNPARET